MKMKIKVVNGIVKKVEYNNKKIKFFTELAEDYAKEKGLVIKDGSLIIGQKKIFLSYYNNFSEDNGDIMRGWGIKDFNEKITKMIKEIDKKASQL